MEGLHRDRDKGILGGVAAGIAEQLHLDITLIRALFIILVLFGKIGIASSFVVYVILWILLPDVRMYAASTEQKGDELPLASAEVKTPLKRSDSSSILGFILVSIGVIMLIDRFINIDWEYLDRLWPLALVGTGVLLVVRATR